MSEAPIGVAVRCQADGTIIEVLSDEVKGPDGLRRGEGLVEVVDEASTSKVEAMFARLREQRVVFDWALNFPFDRRPMLLNCTGMRLGETYLIVGAPSRADAAQLCLATLETLQGEDVEFLRVVARDRVERFLPGLDPGSSLYNELSRLNNDLAMMQRELVKKNYELERLNEQKNYFLGMAAHELRNPLCSIRFYSDFLMEGFDNVSEHKRNRFLSVIKDSSGFMARLIEDLLSISQIESGRLELDLEKINLIELAARNVEINRALAEQKEIDLQFEPRQATLMVVVDPSKVEQVLNNLIMNAIKFSEPGSRVWVRVGPDEKQLGGVLAVQDEGPGIPEEEQDELFQPFRTTSVKATAAERSTGLGLAISQRIAKGHGGRIWVESVVGQGSTFNVFLPDQPLTRLD